MTLSKEYGFGRWAVLLCVLFTTPTFGRDNSTVLVELRDGTSVKARFIVEEGDSLIVTTDLGVRMVIPLGAVARRQILDNGASAPGTSDPSYSRLMLAPTGRPLAEGDGYLSDHYVLFPAVAYGITDNVSLLGGICPREPSSQRGVSSASSWPPTATPIGR
ncbi:MAG: hypothetical protein CME05_10045 [Gemmatimonadaceae bacterium]|nr:hypothetical protein [Gemmatimonadaceae bacterium]|tara:strand:+ start:277 stop:759 length:483 start_codon:yes stop_codon:yes gene_type:complete